MAGSTSGLKYHIFIVLAGVCWGLTGLCNRFATALGYSQEQILFARCIVPCVVLGVYLLVANRSALRIKLRDLWCFLGSGLLSVTMFGLSYMHAMQEMSLSLVVVLLYTSPIFVMFLSALFFHERITRTKLTALALVIVGVLLSAGVFAGSIATTPTGIALGITSGVGYALYSIFSRFAFERGYSTMTVTFYTFLFSSIAVGAVTDISGMVALTTTLQAAGWLLALGVVTCLAPYLLYTKGLEGVENGVASILATVEVVVATIMSTLVFHEPFGLMNGCGVVLLFAGIVLLNVRKNGGAVHESTV